ncbi:MAG: molybdopterin molybdenumtransferase MoeA [Comamonadaceae bacterium]|nr:MAG: molybdopterin molybdenumtransferase MoeA [Comamonadaceae bacterium]
MKLTESGTPPGAEKPAQAPFKPLMPLDTALAQLLSYALPLDSPDIVSTFEADARVLADDVVSQLDVPAHDNSAMDGYAVRSADVVAAGTTLRVSQRIAAGSVGQPLEPGTAARIFTGAPVPAGADAIVMQEDCEALPADGQPQVRVNAVPPAGQHVRLRGEDIASGAVVLRHGARLTPAELGLAASMGFDTLKVSRPVRVALFSTGDELVMPGQVAPADLKPGAIYNSNRFVLRALLLRMGCTVTDLGIVPDQLEATVAALKGASEQHDLVLTSGGVSVGEEDHVKPAVQSLGELNLWQMAIKPGKPFAYGKVAGAHFIGLPGNPVSSFVTFLLLVRPFLLKLQGATELAPSPIPMTANFTVPKADKRREFLRVRRDAEGGLSLFTNQSSGVLTSAVWGDGLVDKPAGHTIAQGDTVNFIPFSALLG